jgi:hypothetical protein
MDRPAHRGRRPSASVLAAVTGMVALAGCGAGQAAPTPVLTSARHSDGLQWMTTRRALSQLRADPVLAAELSRAPVYEILQPGEKPLTRSGTVPTVTFSAVSALSRALAGGQLPAGTKAVLYDPEAWSFTPAAEQRQPVRAAAKAASLARAHHLKIIIAPALNLTTVLARGGTGPRWRQFLDLGLPGKFAGQAWSGTLPSTPGSSPRPPSRPERPTRT